MSARRPIVAANWKMHKTHLEAIQAVQKLSYLLDQDDAERVEVVVCPPFTALRTIQTLIDSDRLGYGLGAQNVHWEDEGAYTGEISPPMLVALKVGYVIVGHSERRAMFGETDESVSKKVRAVFAHRMTPILCVGETLRERDVGATEERVTAQVRADLVGRRSIRRGEAGRRLRADLGHRNRPERRAVRRRSGDRVDPTDDRGSLRRRRRAGPRGSSTGGA